jgi:hypothetical protein
MPRHKGKRTLILPAGSPDFSDRASGQSPRLMPEMVGSESRAWAPRAEWAPFSPQNHKLGPESVKLPQFYRRQTAITSNDSRARDKCAHDMRPGSGVRHLDVVLLEMTTLI